MTMLAYKVVQQNKNGEYWSTIDESTWQVRYFLKRTAKPRRPSSKLLAFDTLEHAVHFSREWKSLPSTWKVFEAEVTNPQLPYIPLVGYYNWDMWWNKKHIPKTARPLCRISWPEGTIFCDTIKLLRAVT